MTALAFIDGLCTGKDMFAYLAMGGILIDLSKHGYGVVSVR